MKIKKILSSVLVTVMLFGAISGLISPIESKAAYVSTAGSNVSLSQEDIETLVNKTIESYSYQTAYDMFKEEFDKGYLLGLQLEEAYSLYINKYTGYLYYINEVTDEIITSNPWNTSGTPSNDDLDRLTSQLYVIFTETASMTEYRYASSRWAASYSQISVSQIKNGFRVNYSIGDTSDRFLLPAGMLASDFENEIIATFIYAYIDIIEKYDIRNKYQTLYTEGNLTAEHILNAVMYDYKYAENDEMLREQRPVYEKDENGNYKFTNKGQPTQAKDENGNKLYEPGEYYDQTRVIEYLGYLNEACKVVFSDPDEYGSNYQITDEWQELYAANQAATMITLQYIISDPTSIVKDYNFAVLQFNAASGRYQETHQKTIDNCITKLEKMFENFPETGYFEKDGKELKKYEEGATPVAGIPVYTLKDNTVKEPYEKMYPSKAKKYANMIKTYCPTYTTSMMLEDEKAAGCEMPVTPKAVFKCSIEYTLSKDGSLNIELPANSISFDESKYTLNEIKVLEFFGAVRYTEDADAYAFFPDGSGMVVKFSDFARTSLYRPLYGVDYAYSMHEASFNYLEQVTVPVFGMISENKISKEEGGNRVPATSNVGFVSIIEEGSSLAKLHLDSGAGHKFGTSYITISPYPQDTFDLSTSISVADSASSYVKVAESKYTGSYRMKINMLSDSYDMANYGESYKTYAASYVGMANCYREYLKNTDQLTALQDVSADLPLYIELLGSMDYVKKILTFPVNSSLALTSFEDVATIYDELANCVKTLNDKAKQKDADAAATEDADEKANCKAEAAAYRELAVELKDLTIKNVNFKLTGFANNGISYTYPSKVKWERACGGKSGFRDLIAVADEKNFGVYPEFDFMYVVNTAMFDGVGTRGYVARHIDNRYATKQLYMPTDGLFYFGFGAVISTDILPELFEKFEGRYAKYEWKSLSLSTFGSTLNSNFDEKNPINREQSMGYVTDVLETANQKGYSIMVDKGNAYTYKYVDHIVDLDIDSSHHLYCSYTVPFLGIVLHGYMNYTGSPINYSGSADYDMLRSIESGANLLYILAYDNTSYMKENTDTNVYYSVNYEHWFTDILKNYNELNSQIGNLQKYTISDHKIILAEKIVNSKQSQENLELVYNEFLTMVRNNLNNKIDAAYAAMKNDSTKSGVDINYAGIELLAYQFCEIVNIEYNDNLVIDTADHTVFIKDATSSEKSVKEAIKEVFDEVAAIRGQVDKNDADAVANAGAVELNSIETYEDETVYNFYTDSEATDEDYKITSNTAVNNNVVMVTYSNGAESVSFVLNFNIYAVSVNIGGEIITLDRYEYAKI